MIKIITAVFLSIWFISGCATSYSCKVVNNELNIVINKPETEKIFFLSSLDGFKRHEIFQNNKGLWEITLPADRDFRFFFIADESIFLPECNQREIDDFGSENCVYIPDLNYQ